MSGYFLIAAFLVGVLSVAFVVRPLYGAHNRGIFLSLTIGLPAIAAALYVFLGSPGINNEHSNALRTNGSPVTSTNSAEKIGSVASMLEGLESRTAENPDDGKSWLLLSRSYKYLGRNDAAVSAYENAVELGEYDAGLASLSSSNVQPLPASISGYLSLSARAAEIVQPTDTVFVFARANSVSGPPAAVLRRPASDLPFNFVLDDSLAMVKEVKLSDFEQVSVTARISRNGDAAASLQGLEAKSDLVTVTGNAQISLTIE